MQVLALSKWNFIAVNTFSLHTRKQSRTLSIIKSNNMVGIYIITQYFSGLLKHYIILGKYDCKKPEYYAYQLPCINYNYAFGSSKILGYLLHYFRLRGYLYKDF